MFPEDSDSKRALQEIGEYTTRDRISELKVITPPCNSPPGAILPDLPIRAQDQNDKCLGLPKEATVLDTQEWLQRNRFTQYEPTFANFSGVDLLRLTHDDLKQICGLADGLRLWYALHANL